MYSAQLGLLLWKHFTIQRRSLISLLLKVCIPALFAIVFMPIRTQIMSTPHPNDTTFYPFGIQGLEEVSSLPLSKASGFSYYPNNSDQTNQIMKQTAKYLNLVLKGFSTQQEMIAYMSQDYASKVFAVEILNDNVKNFTYKLRFPHSPRNTDQSTDWTDWKTNLLLPVFPVLGPRAKNDKYGGDPGYYAEGFLTVQKAIDFSIISQINPEVEEIQIDLKRFSYPPYDDDNFIVLIIGMFPFIILMSFIFIVILTAKEIVHEKETGLKEAMKLMGMSSWVYWISWYIKMQLLLLPSIIVMIVCYKVQLPLKSGQGYAAIVNKTSTSIFSLFLILYSSSLTTFTLACSTLFKKSNSAAAGTGVIYFVSYMYASVISLRFESASSFEKIMLSFINNLGMSLGVQLIGIFEGLGYGINFSNFTKGISLSDTFSMANVLVILFMNNFLHIFFIYYFDNVFPGDHGVAKPWHFVVSQFYKPKTTNKRNENQSQNIELNGKDFFENESVYSARKIGIRIIDLFKEFKQKSEAKTAVENLNLNIYEGQITVLLGHNGAGKSTTISMITGICEPTSGTVLINDKDIVTNTKEARSVLGYCPQHNLLFQDLTVYEHLKFFSKLKKNLDENEINKMLELTNLADKRNALAKTLSGGMKRKLSVAIAFIGGSKTVILDEPSSGMDPQARHSTWILLKKFKNENKCTILLTTHYMDEADFLGDRIAIMSKGSLRCSGSPLFLKSKYSSGYSLVLTKKQNQEESDLMETKQLIDLVQSIVPDAKLNSNINSEITFLLSVEHTRTFPMLFERLDKQKEDLNIINVGISAATVEQVFLKIEESEDSMNKSLETKMEMNILNGNTYSKVDPEAPINDDNPDYGLWIGSSSNHLINNIFLNLLNQFKALIIKRIIYTLRNKTLLLTQVLLPVFILVVYLLIIKYAPIKTGDSPPLSITFSNYSFNYVPYITSTNQNSTDQINMLASLTNQYRNHLIQQSNVQVYDLNNQSEVKHCAKQSKSIDEYNSCIVWKFRIAEHIVATDFKFEKVRNRNKLKITGHFDNQRYHLAPLSLNLITNTLYKHYSNNSEYSINLVNHPLPRNLTELANEINKADITSFLLLTGIQFGFAFLISSFGIFLINERVSGAKHLQHLNGCSSAMFWLSALSWDIFNYLVPVVLAIIAFFVFNVEAFINESRWLSTLAVFLIYGFAHIPQTYLLSYIFKVSSTGFAVLTALNITTSQLTLIITRIMTIPTLNISDSAEVLQIIFLIFFPNYAMAQGLSDMYDNHKAIEICKENQKFCMSFPNPCCRYKKLKKLKPCGELDCLFWNENYWSWEKPGIMKFVVFMLVHFLVQIFILFLIESNLLRNIRYMLSRKGESKKQKQINEQQSQLEKEYGDLSKDSDVCDEETRVAGLRENDLKKQEIFIVDNLKKNYGNFMAVKGISFGMKSSECFGLLGVNGAGKTSTFKMITGDEMITFGDAFINQISIKSELRKFQRQLGYCPQVDPLIEQMTVLETMLMYSRLRGIRNELNLKTCLSLIDLLDLKEHTNKMCFSLSGGNKRKLSVAIALVGSPSLVLLDEPTSGMDPKTRRTLWDRLNQIRNKGKSLVLTTHGMDETEALCTKIGIMVNGELKCFGSLQHLKRRYGDGYSLLLKIAFDPITDPEQSLVNQFISFFLSSFQQSQLKENQDGFVNIHIYNNSPLLFALIFKLVEENKSKYSIEYYVVTQTNLEQIFLNFASKQINSNLRNIPKKMICC